MSSQTVNPQIGFQFPEAIKKDHRERKPLVLEIMGGTILNRFQINLNPLNVTTSGKKVFGTIFPYGTIVLYTFFSLRY